MNTAPVADPVADQFPDDLVRKGAGMAPGAHPHADVAVGPDFAPIIKASFSIQLPAQCTVDFGRIVRWNGV